MDRRVTHSSSMVDRHPIQTAVDYHLLVHEDHSVTLYLSAGPFSFHFHSDHLERLHRDLGEALAIAAHESEQECAA